MVVGLYSEFLKDCEFLQAFEFKADKKSTAAYHIFPVFIGSWN